jgi:hypothetical protein
MHDHEIDPAVRSLGDRLVELGDFMRELGTPLAASLLPVTAAELARVLATLDEVTGRARHAAELARKLLRFTRANPNR